MRASPVLAVLLGAIALTACGGDGDDDQPSPDVELMRCEYHGQPEPHPHRVHRVKVGGGATCKQGEEFWGRSPQFTQDLKPQPPLNSDLQPLGSWVCDARRPGGQGPFYVECEDDSERRVTYFTFG